jgi:small-conductance mechanosensitive channel
VNGKLMKPRQWMATFGLLCLVLAATVGLILTRESGPPETSMTPGHQTPLVDERPLQTARKLASLALDQEEQRFAQQAMKVADHEVDLAFAAGLRNATEHPVPLTAVAKQLYSHVSQAEATVKADEDRIDQLKKQLAAASPDRQDNIQQQIDLIHAQHEYDQDELDDAKEDLMRSGVDPLTRIQRQFNRHEDAEHAYDAAHSQTPPNNVEVNYSAGNLISVVNAWRGLRGKVVQLEQARNEALQAESTLGQSHEALEKQVSAEEADKLAVAQTTSQFSGQAKDANSNETAKAAIATLHRLSVDQKDLSDLDKRIQDHQELANIYGNWTNQVKSNQRAALHAMIRSALLIALILLCAYLAGRLVDHFFADLGPERTRLRTLRVVIRFALQAVAVLLILFVLFGAPNQMPTILGLAGAGLTVAMKDFIVGFFGWFVLMGRNGLRVGDWVEINGVVGEVVEINLLRTVLLETGNWADTGHPTGRKVAFVNSFAIEGHFFNFSTSGQWLWDEIQILVPSNQDPYPIIESIQKMVAKETEAAAHAAEQEWKKAAGSHRAQSVSAAPAVNLRPTTSGVEVHVRYITSAHERYAMRTRLYQQLVAVLHQRPEPQAAGAAVGNKETPA